MHLFFAAHSQNDLITLEPDESFHCHKVLRMKVGEKMQACDGNGTLFTGTLETVHEKACTARIIDTTHFERRQGTLHIAIAPTKQTDRIEWFVEKAVEMGIEEISFIICKNSERKTLKTERLKKIVDSAMKQSRQVFRPLLNEAISLNDFFAKEKNRNGIKLIAHCDQMEKVELYNVLSENEQHLLLIGPEGDFSIDEINSAREHGFTQVSLGNSRLRTETAGMYAVAAFRLIQKESRENKN